jgi:hypothetical protein
MDQNNMYGKRKRDYLASAAVIAVISVIAMIIAIILTPKITVIGRTIIVSEGIVVPAILIGALFWATIELASSSAKKASTVILRAFGGYVLGILIGGVLGFYFSFGQYLLIPAFYGNIGAIYELAAIVFAFLVYIISAVWASSKDFSKKVA